MDERIADKEKRPSLDDMLWKTRDFSWAVALGRTRTGSSAMTPSW